MRHLKNVNTCIKMNEVFLQTIYLRRNRDSGSKNGGSSLHKYQAFSYSIGGASDGYK